jgi:hypothetical protein
MNDNDDTATVTTTEDDDLNSIEITKEEEQAFFQFCVLLATHCSPVLAAERTESASEQPATNSTLEESKKQRRRWMRVWKRNQLQQQSVDVPECCDAIELSLDDVPCVEERTTVEDAPCKATCEADVPVSPPVQRRRWKPWKKQCARRTGESSCRRV